MVFADLSLFGQEIASEKELISCHAVCARSDCPSNDAFWLIRGRKVMRSASPRNQILKSSVLLFPIEIVACGYGIVAVSNVRPHHHQLFRMWVRHRGQ